MQACSRGGQRRGGARRICRSARAPSEALALTDATRDQVPLPTGRIVACAQHPPALLSGKVAVADSSSAMQASVLSASWARSATTSPAGPLISLDFSGLPGVSTSTYGFALKPPCERSSACADRFPFSRVCPPPRAAAPAPRSAWREVHVDAAPSTGLLREQPPRSGRWTASRKRRSRARSSRGSALPPTQPAHPRELVVLVEARLGPGSSSATRRCVRKEAPSSCRRCLLLCAHRDKSLGMQPFPRDVAHSQPRGPACRVVPGVAAHSAA
jgi:hypothetical protein